MSVIVIYMSLKCFSQSKSSFRSVILDSFKEQNMNLINSFIYMVRKAGQQKEEDALYIKAKKNETLKRNFVNIK